MKNSVSITEEQFITKEFADTIAGKAPSPYLRLHDPVQKALVEYAANAEIQKQQGIREYCERMIHFWREVSLAGMPRAGLAMDECYALLFESAFDLAEADPDWALQCLADIPDLKIANGALTRLASHTERCTITHLQLTKPFAGIYAPQREIDGRFRNEFYTPLEGPPWFWAAILAVAGIDEHHCLWPFRCGLAESSSNGWGDRHRLHARLIREAPHQALKTPSIDIMAHPILRIARLKYREDSVEQKQALRFLNRQCIKQGFESEEDCFTSDLPLAQWVRDARQWAINLLDAVALTAIALIRLRRTETELPRPYQVWGYPWTPLVFGVAACAISLNLWLLRPIRSSIGLVIILLGVPFFYRWNKLAIAAPK